ncbi:unnamed protein product [Paramecium sonneborni]|uniref:Uncharacterized protein n=1 Tax=Paramecium sonneborni TaxID=65129 RepID=A0A8S1RA34_9CILI|nr:unnamed protein product [Paramecium sonneborni]
MNIYSSSQQDQIASPDNLSQISWNKAHQSSEQILERSKKIQKRQPQDFQQKWFSIQKISSCKLDISEQNDIDLRNQKIYDFDYLKLDKDLFSKKCPIIVNNLIYKEIEDKRSKIKYQIKPISIKSDIIDVNIQARNIFRNYFHQIINLQLPLKTFSLIQHRLKKLMIQLKKQKLSILPSSYYCINIVVKQFSISQMN